MDSALDALPPEIAKLVSPKWRENELEYWKQRDQLLGQFKDQWIGFADGSVIASGKSPVAVFHEAEQKNEAPFVTCVGHESEPTKFRSSTFTYDSGYPGEPLPKVSVEVRTVSGVPGIMLHEMVADTGADATAITWGDSQRLKLDPAKGRPAWMAGVAGGRAPTLQYNVWAYLDGMEHPCRMHIDLAGGECILGRDVMNRVVMTFDGPAQELTVHS